MATDGAYISEYDGLYTPLVTAEAVRVMRAFGFAGSHVIVIGGIVPSLLVPVPDAGIEPHVGSRDLDLCLSIALVAGDVGAYDRLENSLRKAGFDMAREGGRSVSWRWQRTEGTPVTIEFFCGLGDGREEAGRLFRPGGVVGGKLSALVLAAGRLIDSDTVDVAVDVVLPDGAGHTSHVLKVVGPAAFLASKADALRRRDKPKDAYDIVWLLEGWPGGQAALATHVAGGPIATELGPTVGLLRAEFATVDSAGSVKYGRFMEREADAVDRAARRAVGAVAAFIAEIGSRITFPEEPPSG